MKALRIIAAVVAAAALIAGVWWIGGSVLERRRAAREDAAIAKLKAGLAGGGSEDAAEHNRLGLSLAERGSFADALAHLEIAAERAPADLRYGNDVRMTAIRARQYDRSIRFFEGLTAKREAMAEPRLQLALAYVDKMPDHMMGIVGQGKLSKLSIGQLTWILDHPESQAGWDTRWAATFALGKNHLYWPKAMRHAPAAETAFRGCLELQRDPAAGGKRPCFVLVYEGLGDALVKQGRHDEARAVWHEAQGLFPDDRRLDERLAITDNARLTELVDTERGLGVAVDTDLSILWGRAP